MRVLVVGSGAREHALVAALSADPAVSSIVCAPGNAGTEALAEPRALNVSDAAGVVTVAAEVGADYVIVGPEGPLVAGAADALRDGGFDVFGPSAAAARLEGSKAFAKAVMASAGVPTAGSWHVPAGDESRLRAVLDELAGGPYVVKHDGLAAGKGVVVTDDRDEALAHGLGHDVVVETYLDGPEVSVFCVVTDDGVVPLLPAQDHKRVGDGDSGPNTGGMGAYTPLPWAPSDLVDEVLSRVVHPTVAELDRRGAPFRGLLYVGLALTSSGPQVVEFNVRFGDPETQAILALLDTPITQVLRGTTPSWKEGSSVTVVLAAPGYPAKPELGGQLTGPLAAGGVLHAGTRREPDGRVVSSGGRVLSVTAVGADLASARGSAYELLARINLPGGHYRTDIGHYGMHQGVHA
ncbi:MAG TPA: phosphoribosylamine--glycine ligase [Mycobacteriales bacterium]